jgi:hypothetical protein
MGFGKPKEDIMTEQDLQDLIKEAKGAGASDAKKVDIASVKLAAWPRMKCQFGCPNYGKTLCCPPYTPELPFMKQFIGEYKNGIIIQYTVTLTEEDCKDWTKVDTGVTNGLLEVLLKVERSAMLKNYYKAFALKAGRCRLCETCNLKHCVHPLEARPSLEACGIDVFALIKDNGYRSEMLTGPVKKLPVYGMVLID